MKKHPLDQFQVFTLHSGHQGCLCVDILAVHPHSMKASHRGREMPSVSHLPFQKAAGLDLLLDKCQVCLP